MVKTIEEMEGLIYLEDGTVFKGIGFGARGTAVGELVFNTSMTGYQKILTDPSYKGQIITMTYPLEITGSVILIMSPMGFMHLGL